MSIYRELRKAEDPKKDDAFVMADRQTTYNNFVYETIKGVSIIGVFDCQGIKDTELTEDVKQLILSQGGLSTESTCTATCPLNAQKAGKSCKVTPTAKKVSTPMGTRIVHKGPRGGLYVKLDGKLVSISKLPKKK